MSSDVNFVRQQGFTDGSATACAVTFPALMWQPRIIGVLVAIGITLQAWPLFLALGIVLWWNVAVPRFNPFDRIYNLLVATPRGVPRVPAAPAPRRFSQGMAGSFMLAIAASLGFGWHGPAVVLEALLVTALVALIFFRFCLGSYLYHLLTGRVIFANRTLPWAKERPAADAR